MKEQIIIGSVIAIGIFISILTKFNGNNEEINELQKNQIVECRFGFVGSEIKMNKVNYLVVDNSTIKEHLSRAETLCTTRVTDMRSLFKDNKNFNQNISSWDVSNVVFMNNMFEGATSFNQNLNDWEVNSVKEFEGFGKGSKLEKENYPKFTEENSSF